MPSVEVVASLFCFTVVQACGPLSTDALRRNHLPACLGRLGAGLSLPSATLAQHPISNLPLSHALLVATCLPSQETWFLFLSLTSALALQRAWPGSSPGLTWVLSTPSSAPAVLVPAEQLAGATRGAMN